MSNRPTLFLADGHALTYRAFYAMISRPLRTSRSENTSAPWGITQFLLRLFKEHAPDHVGFVFDAGGHETFRHELYEPYKATREKLDEVLQQDFDLSVRRIYEILEAFRVPVLEIPGYEADDVIATLARRAAERGLQVVIVSGDKDFYQLIDENVALLNPGRGGPAAVEAEWVDPSNAAERLGVPPERVTDYLALIGDASDNVPGVRGIGPKTAVQLIEQYGDLESILSHCDDVPNKRAREALQTYAGEARLSKELVTLRTDLPIELDLESLARREPDRERLREIFLELEFHSLAREFASGPAAARARERAAAKPQVLADAAGVRRWAEQARRRGRFALETVAPPARAREEHLVGLGIAVEPGRTAYVPVAHVIASGAREGELPLQERERPHPSNLGGLDSEALQALADLLADPAARKVGHDLKQVLRVLRRAGVELRGLDFDTMIASYCIDPGRRSHDLETLALEKLGDRTPGYDDLKVEKDRIPPPRLDPESAARYAGERAAAALRLAERLGAEMRDHGLDPLFHEIEMPLIPVLADMEWRGVRIDLPFFETLSRRLAEELRHVEADIYKVAGGEFNINSPVQLREILFQKLGLPILKRTKTGPSTDAEVLEELAQEKHPLPRLLIEYRELAKLKSTYVDALPALVNPETGRVHTSFNQTVTSTGRLSSSDPNLQNIPIRTPLGAELRKGFVPEAGWLMLSADYSQIELRILAHLSQDPAFLEAFRRGGDIHRQTASIIFGVPPEKVTGAMRAQAKTINFATLYGQGPVALSRQLGISVSDGRRFIDQYFERFQGIRAYLDAQVEAAKRQGYVETILGRRRYIPELQSKNPSQRSFGERVATNSPIQGSAADLIKQAMIRLHAALLDRGWQARMILQVHDELVFEAPPEEMDEMRGLVQAEMEGVAGLDVPIAVDAGVGTNWYECK